MSCPKHPDRPVLNAYVCTQQFCAECIEDHKQNYADRMWERDGMRHPDLYQGQGDMTPDGRNIGYWNRAFVNPQQQDLRDRAERASQHTLVKAKYTGD